MRRSRAIGVLSKGRMRAQASPSTWIVNLGEQQIEVYSAPQQSQENAAYSQTAIFGVDAEVPITLQGQPIGRIAVSELF